MEIGDKVEDEAILRPFLASLRRDFGSFVTRVKSSTRGGTRRLEFRVSGIPRDSSESRFTPVRDERKMEAEATEGFSTSRGKSRNAFRQCNDYRDAF